MADGPPASADRSPPGPVSALRSLDRREGLVLAAGLLSALALLWAAFRLVRDPQEEGRAALARVAGEVADALAAEWVRSADALTLGASRLEVTWRPVLDEPPAVAVPRELSALRAGGTASFEALLAEARRLERGERRLQAALDLVLHAIDSSDDPARLAEGRLRAVQLAARAERADVALAQWTAQAGALAGDESIDSVSVLLLTGLAAGPVLDAGARRAVRDELVERWCDGRLALPDPVDAWPGASGPSPAGPVEPPRRAALRGRLDALGDGPDPRLAEDARCRALAAWAGQLGGALPTPPAADRGWTRVPLGPGLARGSAAGWVGLLRTEPDGRARLCCVDGEALAAALAERVASLGLLPTGFVLDGLGEAAGAGPVVRGPLALVPGAVEPSLRHADPEAYASGLGARALWLRAGLGLAALFTGAAALASARALRRARRLTELRRAFVASVSHELRTPAASILLLSENLVAGRPADEAGRARYHALIGREALRLRRLVEDVLDVSRLERGEPVRLRREGVALRPFLADLRREVAEAVAAAGGTLEVEGGLFADPAGEEAGAELGAEAMADLDAEAVRRAVLNLVGNALRHSGSSEVRLEAVLAGKDRLRIAVSDRGRGVPPAARQRIFEPFERLSADGAGTGLGLPIVRGIAAAHGGTVVVDDAVPGPGARFTLELPLQAATTRSEERAR